MTEEPIAYVAERIREAIADGPAHQLGLSVEGDDDHVVIRGTVDDPETRQRVVQTATSLCGSRRLIDELEVVSAHHVAAPEQLP